MVEFIVFVAVLGVVAKSIVRVVMQADIRKLELRREAQASQAPIASDELAQLRAEIARLRDTSTEHALSLQHTVERLDRRVEFLERQRADQIQPQAPVDADSARVARLGIDTGRRQD